MKQMCFEWTENEKKKAMVTEKKDAVRIKREQRKRTSKRERMLK